MRRGTEALTFTFLLLALLAALHRDAVLDGKLLAPFDVLGQYEPWKTALDAPRPVNPAISDQVTLHPWTPIAARRLIEHGVMTLWNPYQGCGTPLHGNTLSAQLYPLMWLHAILSRHAALLAIALIKGLLAGTFFFLLLRQRGTSFGAATCAGLALPLSGFFTVWSGHQQTIVASLLPLLLWLTDRAVDRPSPARLALVGLVSGSTLLAGHLETALHVLLLSTVYGACRCLAFDEPVGRRLIRLAKLAGGYLVGALISMAQVLPFLEYSLNSAILHIRHDPLYRFHNAWRDLQSGEPALARLALVAVVIAIALTALACRAVRRKNVSWKPRDTGLAIVLALAATVAAVFAFESAFSLGLLDHFDLLLDPDRRGSPLVGRAEGSYVGYLLYVEMNCGYASVTALVLAIAALALRKKGDLGALFLATAAVASLAIVFEWPWIAHKISTTPIFAEAKNKRLLLVASIAILWLAAKGIDRLREAAKAGDRKALLAPPLAILVLVVGFLGGRSRAQPIIDPVGAPGVDIQEPGPQDVAHGIGRTGLTRGPEVYLEGLAARDRVFETSPIVLKGWLFAADLPSMVEVVLSGHDRTIAAEIAPRDTDWRESVARDVGTEVAVLPFHATFDVGSAPTGRYAITAIGRGAGEEELYRLSKGGLYVARPSSSPWPVVCGLAALALAAALGLSRRLATLATAGLTTILVVDLFRFADGFNPAVDRHWDFPSTPALDFVMSKQDPEHPFRVTGAVPTLLPANVATAYRIADTRNYDSVDVYVYNSFLGLFAKPAAEGSTRAPLEWSSPLFNLLASRFVLAPQGSEKPAPWFTPVFDGEIAIFENPRALPRCFVAQQAVTESAVIRAGGGDPANPAHAGMFPHALKRAAEHGQIHFASQVVVQDADAERFHAVSRLDTKFESAPPAPARFLVDDFDRLVVEAEAEQDAVLFLADAFMPGWTARIYVGGGAEGGEAIDCARVNLAFRAIPFPKGKHTVEFRYEPASAAWGMRSLWLGLAIALAMLTTGWARAKR